MPARSLECPALPLTGERTSPGIARENYWFRRHEVVYDWLTDALSHGRLDGGDPGTHRDLVVLDAGCGEGYGVDRLSSAADRCLAMDLDFATMRHVRRTYATPARGSRVSPVVANLDRLPLRDGAADVIVSFQVIEHLWDPGTFLAECWRVLVPGGSIWISTPNRSAFSPTLRRGEKPLNPFHVQEFDADQLADLMTEAGFSETRMLGLRHGPRISAWESQHGPIADRLIAAIVSDRRDAELEDFASRVTAEDFEISVDDVHSSLDLVSLARRPATEAPATK